MADREEGYNSCEISECEQRCPECGKFCVSKDHQGWQHRCPEGHTWWTRYCYSLWRSLYI